MTEVLKDERRTRRRDANEIVGVALDGRLLFKCPLVDFSEDGARLRAGDQDLPPRFQLIDIAGGVAHSARLVWRRKGAVGIAYLHAWSLADGDGPEWLQTMWRELKLEAEAKRPAA